MRSGRASRVAGACPPGTLLRRDGSGEARHGEAAQVHRGPGMSERIERSEPTLRLRSVLSGRGARNGAPA
ncbi:hypothetical protein Vlu01_08760 [Micromonospora lutea]|uniref:Uncharacterized protein n=1 Tax=Micromonospora lutea TaxID=419825 RepID=A0ABQ4IQR3_9ACTN|nr:hypothetical protein Vlu01_08760 [Micromonospora lutea]